MESVLIWTLYATILGTLYKTKLFQGCLLTPCCYLLGWSWQRHNTCVIQCATPIRFSRCDLWGYVLLDDPMLLIFPQRRFSWRSFDLCWLFVYMAGCSPACDMACSILKDIAWYSSSVLVDLMPDPIWAHAVPNWLWQSFNEDFLENILFVNVWAPQCLWPKPSGDMFDDLK